MVVTGAGSQGASGGGAGMGMCARKVSQVVPGLAVSSGHSQSSGRAAAPDLRSRRLFHMLLLE